MEPLLANITLYHFGAIINVLANTVYWYIFLIDALGCLAEDGKAVITLSSILFKICFLTAFCLYNTTAGSCPLQMEVMYATANNHSHVILPVFDHLQTEQKIGFLVFEVGHL